MKKVAKTALALLGAALVMGMASCRNDSDDSAATTALLMASAMTTTASGPALPAPAGCVYVPAKTFNGAAGKITGSKLFIEGRKLSLPAMFVSEHEVTQKEFRTYCLYIDYNHEPRAEYGKGDNYPVYWISWYDAIAYCNQKSKADGLTLAYKMKVGEEYKKFPEEWPGIHTSGTGAGLKCRGPESNDDNWNAIEFDTSANGWRLPTEAEWEMLTRGGNLTNVGQTRYSGSNFVKDVAWCVETCNPYGMSSHEVKTKAKNGLGLYDLGGNVWEWCWDHYNAIDSNTPWTGPAKSLTGSNRVIRGGSWNETGYACLVYIRCVNHYSSDLHDEQIGFRVVRNAVSN